MFTVTPTLFATVGSDVDRTTIVIGPWSTFASLEAVTVTRIVVWLPVGPNRSVTVSTLKAKENPTADPVMEYVSSTLPVLLTTTTDSMTPPAGIVAACVAFQVRSTLRRKTFARARFTTWEVVIVNEAFAWYETAIPRSTPAVVASSSYAAAGRRI